MTTSLSNHTATQQQVMSPHNLFGDSVKLTIPTFDGKPENYDSWSKQFKDLAIQLGFYNDSTKEPPSGEVTSTRQLEICTLLILYYTSKVRLSESQPDMKTAATTHGSG